MGWKNVKEHYRIKHIVQIEDGCICIGSPYIHNIIRIDMSGDIIKRYKDRNNPDLNRYQKEMDDDPAKLKELIKNEDTFSKYIRVYTYRRGEIFEKFCEELGWPNITHDGCIMYENYFSTDKDKVIRIAIENALAAMKLMKSSVKDAEKQLHNLRYHFCDRFSDYMKLKTLQGW